MDLFPAGQFPTPQSAMNFNMQKLNISLPLLGAALIAALSLSSCSIIFKEFLVNWSGDNIHVRSDSRSWKNLLALDSARTDRLFDLTADSALILPPGGMLPIGTALNVVDERDFVYDTLLIMRPGHEPLLLDRRTSADWIVYMDEDSLSGMYLIIQD